MLKIKCNPSPYTFQPINILIQKIGWQPESLDDFLVFHFLNPHNKSYKNHRTLSHKTDAQKKENQLRFLGSTDVERKLLYISSEIIKRSDKNPIQFLIPQEFIIPEKFQTIIKHLNLYSGNKVSIRFQSTYHNTVFTEQEKLYFSSNNNRKQNAELLYECATDCMYAQDYWSAINFLLSIRDLEISNKLELKTISILALAYRVTGDIFKATFYSNELIKKGSSNQKNGAKFSLAMLNMRGYPNKFKNLKDAKKLLSTAYIDINNSNYNLKRKKIDLEINRNGYALALYKSGKIDDAIDTIKTGIKKLKKINTSHSIFHRSVLFYNLSRCYTTTKDHTSAIKTLKKLIKKDKKYYPYYLDLSNIYLSQLDYKIALKIVSKGIKITPNIFQLHYLKGIIYYNIGSIKNATNSFENAIKLNPYDYRSLAYLTTIYNIREKYKKTLKITKHFNIILNNNSQGEIIFNNRLTAMLGNGKLKKLHTIYALIEQFKITNPESTINNELIEILDSI